MNTRLSLICILILLSGCFGSKDNTEPPAPLVELTPTLTLKTLWTADIGSGDDTGHAKLIPVAYDGKLFTASTDGLVQALDLTNGKPIWQQELDVPISGGPGIGEGLILVGSKKGEVIALSEIDGVEQWRTQVSSEILATPRISQGIAVVRTGDGKLFGLDSKNGSRLWIYERTRASLLSLRGTSTPILIQDLIIAGFDNGKIALLELRTGKVLWETAIAVPRGRTELERMVDIDADPILEGEIVYVASYQGHTVAIDLAKGGLLWQKQISSYAGLGADSSYLYITDPKSHVYALERHSGDDWWRQDKLQARGVTAPVSIGDYVVVGDMEGYLHWMSQDDGSFVARHRIGKTPITLPALVIDDTLIAYNSDGKIVALGYK
ncbi:outer membrane protein assembly factor BamB [Candidatus Halobeggiatoa sp. HSG11]|nr:outer membrane protein assembly factor BamB [Candidatus Halobeggiatoa sp. HSG11]